MSFPRSIPFLFCPALFIVSATGAMPGPVRVSSGQVAGVPASDSSLTVFKGIPYAAPPVGDLRWKPPAPAAPWQGIRKADAFSPDCIRDFAAAEQESSKQSPASEDCLYLNVWTGAASAGEKRPVTVYLSGLDSADAERDAKAGALVVTINYRRGLMGFFAHPELTAESEHHSSGNYGLLDQIAALAWVKANIAAFGGDPNRITVKGVPKTTASVRYLTASPLAKGLFANAEDTSPGEQAALNLKNLADAESQGAAFANAENAHALKFLRAMTPADIRDGAPTEQVVFGPVIDGWVLTEDSRAKLGQSK